MKKIIFTILALITVVACDNDRKIVKPIEKLGEITCFSKENQEVLLFSIPYYTINSRNNTFYNTENVDIEVYLNHENKNLIRYYYFNNKGLQEKIDTDPLIMICKIKPIK